MGSRFPWSEVEVSATLELRTAIGANLLKRYERLRDFSEEVDRKQAAPPAAVRKGEPAQPR